MTEDQGPNAKQQVRDESDHPECETADDEDNVDDRHPIDQLAHAEAALYRFVDRALPLDSVLSLGAQILDEGEERIAEHLDSLVSKGLLRCRAGVVDRPGVSDIYNERLLDSDESRLEATAEPDDEMERLCAEWVEIVERHPEWTIVRKPEFRGEALQFDMGDPFASMETLKGKLMYDPSKVRPEDKEEFERFLELDRRIEGLEGHGGKSASRTARLISRAMTLWRMAGGRVPGIGLYPTGPRVVSAGIAPGRGDIVQAIAEDIAERDHNSQLAALPLNEQMRVMEKAEQIALERYPLAPTGAFGAPDSGDSGDSGDGSDQPPAPDPDNGVDGWERETLPDGKSRWRAKNNPQITVERPEDAQG